MPRLAILVALPLILAGCAGHGGGNYDETGEASFYGNRHAGKRTASGERYSPNLLTAAHRDLPLGSHARVTNLNNDRSVVVRINDRGPYTRGRIIDLSRKAAEAIGLTRSGTAPVRVQQLD
nr:septal ring lytic transglycosylase RlpA family protein [Pseudomonas panipatensis]